MNYHFLKDYQTTPYAVDSLHLDFEIFETYTLVTTVTSFRDVEKTSTPKDFIPLELHGEKIELLEVWLNEKKLSTLEYKINDSSMILQPHQEKFHLKIKTKLYPDQNKALEGLYRSGSILCTQCEAQGFRRITFAYDRPDVMAKYEVKITASKEVYPDLLSNGNLVAKGELKESNRHWVQWSDPFPKPSYLFALVAGKMGKIEDIFTTRSGRTIQLEIYSEPKNISKSKFALESLKRAMKWDEDVYGLECDLDNYKIVSVSDFNAGAMENKGLNIFNEVYVSADPQTATDNDYEGVEGVIGHEYFHNWTGNRITCRDWFQLCLKEGLTVFRDQEFSSDMGTRAVHRIKEVSYLKSVQFQEDDGPTAHPPRPDRYMEINNFYTATVYRKGAEIVRMMHVLLGPVNFRKGMDLYFSRHDGQAVTQEDFVQALTDACGVPLSGFMDWYTQAGTPRVDIRSGYDAKRKEFKLHFIQETKPTLFEKDKKVLPIPIKIGLLGKNGSPIALHCKDLSAGAQEHNGLLVLQEKSKSYVFENVHEKPIPSLFRDFSAPVHWNFDYTLDDLKMIMIHDSDPFNCWDATQKLFTNEIVSLANQFAKKPQTEVASLKVDPSFLAAMDVFINESRHSMHLKSLALSMPPETTYLQLLRPVSIDALHKAKEKITSAMGLKFKDYWTRQYHNLNSQVPYAYEKSQIGNRAFRNTCLTYLSYCKNEDFLDLLETILFKNTNMTEISCALNLVAGLDHSRKPEILEKFYVKWKSEELVIDRWLAAQARSTQPDVLTQIKNLLDHPSYNSTNPNRVRALIATFVRGNYLGFHLGGEKSYVFCREQVEALDKFNPQIAARIVSSLINFRDFPEDRASLMRQQLKYLEGVANLSPDVFEIVSKSLM